MTACDASFYTHGIKIRSRQSHTDVGGRTLAVVCGSEKPGHGEIHVDQLQIGSELFIDGLDTPLSWRGRGEQSRNDRHFDQTALQTQFGEQYPQIVAIAAGNLSFDGAKESRGYARAVADAYTRTLDPVGIALHYQQTPGALLSVSIDVLSDQLHHNGGAIAALAEQVSRSCQQGGAQHWQRTLELILASLKAVPDKTAPAQESRVYTQRNLWTAISKSALATRAEQAPKLINQMKRLITLLDDAVDVERDDKWYLYDTPEKAIAHCKYLLGERGYDQSDQMEDPWNRWREFTPAESALYQRQADERSRQLAAQHDVITWNHYGWVRSGDRDVRDPQTGMWPMAFQWAGVRADGSVVVCYNPQRVEADGRPEHLTFFPSIEAAFGGHDGIAPSEAVTQRQRERAEWEENRNRRRQAGGWWEPEDEAKAAERRFDEVTRAKAASQVAGKLLATLRR